MKKKGREFDKKRAGALRTVGAAALMIAAGAMILHGCTAQSGEALRGGDSDPLRVIPAADEVMGVAENGTLYDYFWAGEIEEQKLMEEYEKKWDELLEGYRRNGVEGQTIEKKRDEYLLEMDRAKKELQRIKKLDPVVSAQEAANTAGMLFESVYGFKMDGRSLFLDCTEANGGEENGRKRLIWQVQGNSEEGVGFCTVDATTGRMTRCSYAPSEWEIENCTSEELLPVIREYSEEGRTLYAYDPTHPQWPDFAEEKREQIRVFLEQAGLDKNGAVEAIQLKEGEAEQLRFTIEFEGGEKAQIGFSLRPWYVSDWGEYPGKAMEYSAQ